jgi:protein-disulfide isomerase
MKFPKKLLLIPFFTLSLCSCAKDPSSISIETLEKELMKFNVKIKETKEIGSNLFLVILENGNTVAADLKNEILFVSKGVSVDAINLRTGISIMDEIKRPIIKSELSKVENYIEIKSPKENHIVYMFFDPACGICHQMFSVADSYLEEGITLRLVGTPIMGEQSKLNLEKLYSAKTEEQFSILLSNDYGKHMASESGLQTLNNHISSGRSLGVDRTPYLFTLSGSSYVGYIPAKQLRVILEKKN